MAPEQATITKHCMPGVCSWLKKSNQRHMYLIIASIGVVQISLPASEYHLFVPQPEMYINPAQQCTKRISRNIHLAALCFNKLHLMSFSLFLKNRYTCNREHWTL